MTVSSIVPVNNYTGNSSTKLFDFDFLIENEKELVVQYQDKNGIIYVLKYGIDYSINEIGNKNGSYIEFPLNGSVYGILQPDEQISLALSLQIKQESEFHNSSYFNLDVLEWTFDYIVRILQILNRKIDRCIKVEESVAISPDEILSELNDKYEKVNSSYSQIVEISKSVEQNKNISIEEKNKTIEYSIEAKEQAELAKQKAKEAGLIIGEKVTMFSPEYVPECCLSCDGATYSRSQFEDFCNNYLGGKEPLLSVCTLAEYEAEVATYGQCSKFAADRITKIGFEKISTSATININFEQFRVLFPDGVVLKFVFNGSSWTLDGKVVNLDDYALSANGMPTKNDYFTVGYWFGYVNTFRVPLINSIDENKYFVVVGNAQIKESAMNWSAWASGLQGKANADLSNCTRPYIVETSDKSILPSWYRVWSDGWCEQGGEVTVTSETNMIPVTFIKSYVKEPSLVTSVSSSLSYSSSTTSANVNTVVMRAGTTCLLSTTGFNFCHLRENKNDGAGTAHWNAKGYIK